MGKATLERVAEACITAHKLVMQHGTPEMREVARHLLFVVGRELARREQEAEEPQEVDGLRQRRAQPGE